MTLRCLEMRGPRSSWSSLSLLGFGGRSAGFEFLGRGTRLGLALLLPQRLSRPLPERRAAGPGRCDRKQGMPELQLALSSLCAAASRTNGRRRPAFSLESEVHWAPGPLVENGGCPTQSKWKGKSFIAIFSFARRGLLKFTS